ncbi:MAG: YciI family protein [Bacteroidota bacterium]
MKSLIRQCSFVLGLLFISASFFSQAKENQTSAKLPKVKMETPNSELKEYILLVRVPLSYGPEQAKEVREQWNALLDKWKADGTFITSYVYPSDGYLVTGAEKSVTKESYTAGSFKLVSNMILNAPNYEAALELAKKCPVLAQGGVIEVREIQPRVKTGK